MKKVGRFICLVTLGWIIQSGCETREILVPQIDGEWWQVAGNPMDHKYATERQEPVDFAVWQAADGSWQIWSCLRKTTAGGDEGGTRVFYGWEGRQLTDSNWKPLGIVMEADASLGETPGGLQAPHVVKVGDIYHMFYGDWVNICHGVSKDGKSFERVIQRNGRTGMFTEGAEVNTRDIMLMHHENTWYGYYTAFTNKQGKVLARTTKDLTHWSEPGIVSFGGQAGVGNGSSECPHVVKLSPKDFYLFKTQTYGRYDRDKDDLRNRGVPETRVYHSEDPMMFGIDQDEEYFVTLLPVAAPEIVSFEGQYYIFALNQGELDGIRCAKLKWVQKSNGS
jgi:hypothetical protein